METEREKLRAELRRLNALLASRNDEKTEDDLLRRIEQTEERLRKIWNGEWSSLGSLGVAREIAERIALDASVHPEHMNGPPAQSANASRSSTRLRSPAAAFIRLSQPT
jgi:hypothetical protein